MSEHKPDIAMTLVKGLAPTHMAPLERWLYGSVRLIYLLVTAAAFPLALNFVHNTKTVFVHVPAVVAWIVAFAAVVWILVYVALEQYNYPLRLPGAALLTASALSSAWSGAALENFNIEYGAYHMLIGGLSAQFIFMGVSGVGFSALKVFRHPRGRDLPLLVLLFIVFLFLAYGVLLLILIGPLVSAFRQEKNPILIAAALLFLLSQVVSDMRILWQGSILNPTVMKDPLRNDLHNAWSGPSAIAIIAAVVAAGIIAIW